MGAMTALAVTLRVVVAEMTVLDVTLHAVKTTVDKNEVNAGFGGPSSLHSSRLLETTLATATRQLRLMHMQGIWTCLHTHVIPVALLPHWLHMLHAFSLRLFLLSTTF